MGQTARPNRFANHRADTQVCPYTYHLRSVITFFSGRPEFFSGGAVDLSYSWLSQRFRADEDNINRPLFFAKWSSMLSH